MPVCPTCQTAYPAGVAVCALDGAPLDRDDPAPAPRASEGGVSGPTRPTSAVAPAAAVRTPTPESFDPLLGSTLAGRYLIIRRIGEGGMGAVYEARHTVIGKRIAVKVLLEKFHAKSDFVARLLQEARLASSIGHQNIVDVTDFGTTDDGRSFVIMEFLDGEPLAQLVMRDAPLPVERCLRIGRQVASALGAAHAKGIFHRDVKPENVYLVKRGDEDFVKVVDFGISKAVKQGGDEGPETYRLTHTGLLLGTPLYMSPEQARGEEDLDHRVDIWALGVLLYECLTGEVPFRANNYLGIISQVLTHQATPPSRLRPELGIPTAVEAVVMRAMEKDRGKRYQAIADLERDLDRLLAGDQNVGLPDPSSTQLSPPSALETGPRRWHLGLAAFVALVVGLAFALSRSPAERQRATGTGLASEKTLENGSAGTIAAPPAAVEAPAPAATVAPPTADNTAGLPRSNVKAATRAPQRRGAHGDRKPPSGPANGVGPETSESAKRGVLPLRSREAYPDQ
jgi:serine/threonine-protein kinase